MFFGDITTLYHFGILILCAWAVAAFVYILLFTYYFYEAANNRGISFWKHYGRGLLSCKPGDITDVILDARPLADEVPREEDRTPRLFSGQRIWVVQKDILITIKDPYTAALLGIDQGGHIRIPRGFETDGASVPRFFWFISSPSGMLFRAALLHDYAYAKGGILVDGNQVLLKKPILFWELLFMRITLETNGPISFIIHLIPFLVLVCFGMMSGFGWKKTTDEANRANRENHANHLRERTYKKFLRYFYPAFNFMMGILILYLFYVFFLELFFLVIR